MVLPCVVSICGTQRERVQSGTMRLSWYILSVSMHRPSSRNSSTCFWLYLLEDCQPLFVSVRVSGAPSQLLRESLDRHDDRPWTEGIQGSSVQSESVRSDESTVAFDEVNDVIRFTGEFDTKYQSVTNPVCVENRSHLGGDHDGGPSHPSDDQENGGRSFSPSRLRGVECRRDKVPQPQGHAGRGLQGVRVCGAWKRVGKAESVARRRDDTEPVDKGR